jgi:hypothetical protein
MILQAWVGLPKSVGGDYLEIAHAGPMLAIKFFKDRDKGFL